MATPLPPPPSLRSIGLGLLSFAVLLGLVCSASSVVKWVGASLMVLPRTVGLLKSVRGDEIVTFPMDTTPTAVVFPRAETYHLYSGDLELLEIAASLDASNSTGWLVLTNADSGENIPVAYVGRGLMPFDDPRASGRPILRFTVPEPGTYVVSHPRRPFPVYFVPDRTTGYEAVIAAVYLTQLALLALPVVLVVGRPWLARRRAWREHQRERRLASDAVIQRRTRRNRPGA